tara:strand:+ start:818 stop:1120 length:303 start_codon:yes stop_codon:yes gene_type:complete
MAYQVIYDIQGEALKDTNNVFDPTSTKGQAVIDIFNAYVGKEWIIQYERTSITESHVEDRLVFIDKDKRDSFKTETEAARGENDSDITPLTVTVKEEGEV